MAIEDPRDAALRQARDIIEAVLSGHYPRPAAISVLDAIDAALAAPAITITEIITREKCACPDCPWDVSIGYCEDHVKQYTKEVNEAIATHAAGRVAGLKEAAKICHARYEDYSELEALELATRINVAAREAESQP